MTRVRRPRSARRGIRLVPSPVRAAALLALLAALLAAYGLATAPVFGIQRIDVSPLRWTDRAAVLAGLGVEAGTNAFRLSTAGLAERLERLPTVASATVSVALPDRLTVSITERTPILAWRAGTTTFLVDRDGMLFAMASQAPDAAAALPVIDDRRSTSRLVVTLGAEIDPVDLDAATRLASLTPADIGSTATALAVVVTDADGFVLTTRPASWTAVFGSYGHVLRSPDLIPGQVRLLKSLLFGREAQVARVVLADDRNGTYVPLASPR